MKSNFNLDTLAGGAFAERVNQAIQEVMENIADPNTPWKTKRKINVEMTFETNEDRDITLIDVVAKPKLAPREAIHVKVLIDKTLEGEVIGSEFKKQIPGQQAIKIDPSTGEVLNSENEDVDLEGIRLVK